MSLGEKMRVGYVVKRYPRFSETFIVNEILAHEAAGLEVEIFALHPPVDTHFQDSISRVRAAVHYLPSRLHRPSSFWSTVRQAGAALPDFWSSFAFAEDEDVLTVYQALVLAMEVQNKQISHLHAHFATSPTSVARLAARFAAIPHTFTAHAKDIYHQSVSRQDLARKLREAAAAITVSDYNVSYLQSQFAEAAGRVVRIYNGLNLEEFPFAPPRNRPPRILAVGRLIPKKGFSTLIDACAVLAKSGCQFSCDIIGCGELEESLRAQIDHLNLQDQVCLLGPQPRSEVVERLREACVFAAPCVVGDDGNRDGLPTVLLEAMAIGTPCVSTDVTGICEVVRDGKTGLLVPQYDARSLADALQRLLSSAPLREQLAVQAREMIDANFDIATNAAAIRQQFYAAHDAANSSSDAILMGVS